ncbi:MFS general substrate transporter, partial [Neoconidiobolus thromboides FSU 785]
MNQTIELREHQVDNAKSYELPNEDGSNEKINLSKAQFIIIMIGLFFTISVAALDTTIITTSVGVIASDLNGFQDIAWVATAYFLTSNAFELLYGKFSDIFGRKPTILFALSIFLIGSILCGVAQNIEMLIIARAIAGIGGGGLMTLCTIIISDLVPLKKRGYYMGLTTGIFTVSSTLGSILGGIFVLKLSWRWCFYINIPICVIAMIIIIVFFRFPSDSNNFKEKLNRVDYFGCITLLIFTILLTLALNWGGQTYSWSSAAVLVPLVLSIMFMFAFIYLQLKVSKEPIIPSNILVRNVNACGLITFCNGTIFFSIIIYIPLYNQIAYQESSLQSTIGILPVICGMIVCSIFSGSIISRTGKYRFFSIIGTLLGFVGSILLTQFVSVDVSRTLIYIFTAVVGAGIGLCMQATTIASQAAVG